MVDAAVWRTAVVVCAAPRGAPRADDAGGCAAWMDSLVGAPVPGAARAARARTACGAADDARAHSVARVACIARSRACDCAGGQQVRAVPVRCIAAVCGPARRRRAHPIGTRPDRLCHGLSWRRGTQPRDRTVHGPFARARRRDPEVLGLGRGAWPRRHMARARCAGHRPTAR